ncbi:hypothetical protein SUGI_0891510 [Cryptomeria japonica]|nr:hypothetical protein SUGI_0891510 [Cryptomeria japonica]
MAGTMMERSFSFVEVALQYNMEDEHFSRKPYHRHCKCGVHSFQNKTGHRHNCSSLGKRSIGFPMRRVWSETNLSTSHSPSTATKLCHSSKPKMYALKDLL